MVNSAETVGKTLESATEAPAGAEVQAEETGTEEPPASDEEAAPAEGNPETDPVPTAALEAETEDPVFQEPDDVLQEDSAEPSEEASSDATCNICHNPACGRLKGEPRTKCITYKR